ncbi:MAG TPA: trehalase family glycosidase [Terriglobales bacterium]|nr:trehalase family glycosidase [Terriglobales bacterium]
MNEIRSWQYIGGPCPVRLAPHLPRLRRGRAAWLLAAALCTLWLPSLAAENPAAPPPELADVARYIHEGWDRLTRSMSDCAVVHDPKVGDLSVLYLPFGLETPGSVRELETRCAGLRVDRLPKKIERLGQVEMSQIRTHGVLYLPHAYVVPGGRFNEMYGWDSYFILLGLLRDGRLELARGMVENFFFEIEHYGAVLNANRTYFLTRSQPPFLTSMVLAVYEADPRPESAKQEWLARAYDYAVRDHRLWTTGSKLAGETGLSRYYDFGEGPVPEIDDSDLSDYRGALRYFLLHREEAKPFVVVNPKSAADSPGPHFPVYICNPQKRPGGADRCDVVQSMGLTADYYKGDRAMRESGFDISFRFGPFSGRTHHYAPVCLNSLLYKAETDLEKMSRMLGREQDARQWQERATRRKENIQKYLWDEARGLFMDYDFTTGKRSSYEYATTFYPLWAGLATPEQARALARNLARFEHPGGLAMSRNETRTQWDYPYGWAPIQLLAAEGFRRYGFADEANRLSYEFLSTVLENFRRDGTIREKYNVVTRSSETQVAVGYSENVIGFGWTNGVFLELLHQLPQEWVKRLAEQAPPPTAGSADRR